MFVIGLSILVLHFSVAIVAYLPVILAVYVPLGYYVDLYVYNRRQRQKAAKK